MKKFVFAFALVAMFLLSGCDKKGNNSDTTLDKTTWKSLVATYPFLEEFPVFEGEIENCQYRELGSDMKTVTFFDYKCEESVATSYYAKFASNEWSKTDGSYIYRKTTEKYVFMFTGSYSAGNFALSFAVDVN